MAGPLQTLANRSPVPHIARSRTLDLGAGNVTASKTDQLSQMERVATLFSIADLIATSVAEVDWHLYRQPGRPEAERTEVFDHPALVVLATWIIEPIAGLYVAGGAGLGAGWLIALARRP